jgi:hypothetical protein
MKCDFCDNEAVDYTIQEYFLYCLTHKQEAEERAFDILNYVEWCESNQEFESDLNEVIIP